MPFTLSHPAAVVPLKRTWPEWTVLSALVVGSMTPDLASVVPSTPFVPNPYAPEFVFGAGLPVGLFALWFFHAVLKRPIVQLFPKRVRKCLEPYCQTFHFLPFGRFVCVLLSLLLAMCIHLFWDSMTHGHGWMVQRFVFFRESCFTAFGYPMVTYFLFKHFGTLLGLSLLLYWSVEWLHYADQTRAGARRTPLSWRIVTTAAILVSCGLGSVALAIVTTEINYGTVSRLVRYIGMGCGGVLVAYCLGHFAMAIRKTVAGPGG